MTHRYDWIEIWFPNGSIHCWQNRVLFGTIFTRGVAATAETVAAAVLSILEINPLWWINMSQCNRDSLVCFLDRAQGNKLHRLFLSEKESADLKLIVSISALILQKQMNKGGAVRFCLILQKQHSKSSLLKPRAANTSPCLSGVEVVDSYECNTCRSFGCMYNKRMIKPELESRVRIGQESQVWGVDL